MPWVEERKCGREREGGERGREIDKEVLGEMYSQSGKKRKRNSKQSVRNKVTSRDEERSKRVRDGERKKE